MSRVVQILGTAPNLCQVPLDAEGVERWCSNNPHAYRKKFRPVLTRWTAWFNLHSKEHMLRTYPVAGYEWYKKRADGRPFYFQQPHDEIPGSQRFPATEILAWAGHKYFTCTGAWQIAFAAYQQFDRIELYGFELTRQHLYDFQRPCFFYWVEEARRRGIDVYLPPNVVITPGGDPASYDGPIYGYETTLPHFSLT